MKKPVGRSFEKKTPFPLRKYFLRYKRLLPDVDACDREGRAGGWRLDWSRRFHFLGSLPPYGPLSAWWLAWSRARLRLHFYSGAISGWTFLDFLGFGMLLMSAFIVLEQSKLIENENDMKFLKKKTKKDVNKEINQKSISLELEYQIFHNNWRESFLNEGMKIFRCTFVLFWCSVSSWNCVHSRVHWS